MTYPVVEAEELRRFGVRRLFGVPGSGPSYDLLDACERAGVPFTLAAHEASAAMMAGASTRISGKPGAVISIKGPGVANLLGGLALAHFENYPVLSFSEAFAPDAPEHLQHKRMRQDDALAAVTKAIFYRHGDRSSVSSMVKIATSEPAGPVHLNLADGFPPTADDTREQDRSDDFGPLLDWLALASRPVLILGSALARLELPIAVRHRLESLQLPLFTTAAAKGVIDETKPCSAGVFTGAGAELAPESTILALADRVVGVGLRSSELLVASPFRAPLALVDLVSGTHDHGLNPERNFRAPLVPALSALADGLTRISWGLDAIADARRHLSDALRSDELLPAPVYERLAQTAGGQGRLVTDSGNFTVVAEHVWNARRHQDFIGSSTGRYMGAGLPQAIGVALDDRSRPTFCTVGDGGLPPFVAEMKIAVESRLPIALILMSDGHFGSMRRRITERGLTEVGIRVPNPSWIRVMDGLGCSSTQVETLADFETALDRWDSSTGPLFIEATMPEGPYVEMVRHLRR